MGVNGNKLHEPGVTAAANGFDGIVAFIVH
jgi:hypothetical protein